MRVIEQHPFDLPDVRVREPPVVRSHHTQVHHRILQAIEARDADAARRRAERDVQAYAKHLELAVKTTGLQIKAAAGKDDGNAAKPSKKTA